MTYKHLSCAGMILSIFLVANAASSSGQTPSPATDATTYNFGLIPLGTEIRHTFILTNSGKNPLGVVKVSTSCGCTKVASYPTQIAAGAQGEIVAVMNHQHTGYTDIAIYVQTGPKATDLYTYHLVGLLIAKPGAPAGTNSAMTMASDVIAQQKSGKPVVLIDVRPLNLFVQAHAKGSQNISPFALEARGDMKKKTLVLINEGTADPALLTRMDRLKGLGFKDVHLLTGGLRAWEAAGGAMEGTARPQSASLALLSPADFYAEQKTDGHWFVIDIDPAPVSIPTAYPVKNIPTGSDARDFVKKLAAFLATQPPVTRVLITSQQGDGYDRVEQSLRAASIPNSIYYLQSGIAAYATYAQQQTASQAPQTMTLMKDHAYLASDHTSGQVVRGGGCASCGH